MFEINPVLQLSECVSRHKKSDKPAWVPPRPIRLLDQVHE